MGLLKSVWTALRSDLNGKNGGSLKPLPRFEVHVEALRSDLNGKNGRSLVPFARFEVCVEALRSDLNKTSTVKTQEALSRLLVFTAVEVHPSLAFIILKGVPRM